MHPIDKIRNGRRVTEPSVLSVRRIVMEAAAIEDVANDIDRCALTTHRWLRNSTSWVRADDEQCRSEYGIDGTVECLLDGRLDTSWGTIVDGGHGSSWVVFEFPNTVEISGLRYYCGNAMAPKGLQLHSSDKLSGPWEVVRTWEASPNNGPRSSSPNSNPPGWSSNVWLPASSALFYRLEVSSSLLPEGMVHLNQVEFFGCYPDSAWNDNLSEDPGTDLRLPSQVETDPRGFVPIWMGLHRWYVAPLEAENREFVSEDEANDKQKAGRSWVWCRFPDQDSLAIQVLTLTLTLTLTLIPAQDSLVIQVAAHGRDSRLRSRGEHSPRKSPSLSESGRA